MEHKRTDRHLARRGALGLVLFVGFALILANARSDVDADERADAAATPVLEVTIDTVTGDAASVRTPARGVDAALAKQPGFVRSEATVLPGPAYRLMRATVWSSVEAAEAASLAADGSAHERAMLQVVNAKQRTVRHLRQLRTHTYVKGATGHLEVTLYRTRPGTTREANLARLDAAESDFSKAEGILGHSTWIAPNGRWVHLVRWRSKADFARTGKALMRTKGVGGWIRSLDYKRFSVLKGDPLR